MLTEVPSVGHRSIAAGVGHRDRRGNGLFLDPGERRGAECHGLSKVLNGIHGFGIYGHYTDNRRWRRFSLLNFRFSYPGHNGLLIFLWQTGETVWKVRRHVTGLTKQRQCVPYLVLLTAGKPSFLTLGWKPISITAYAEFRGLFSGIIFPDYLPGSFPR